MIYFSRDALGLTEKLLLLETTNYVRQAFTEKGHFGSQNDIVMLKLIKLDIFRENHYGTTHLGPQKVTAPIKPWQCCLGLQNEFTKKIV